MVPKRAIKVSVNGRIHESSVAPRLLLCDYLRDELELTGTHIGCSVGTCGACTILLEGEPVRSCLLLAVQVDAMTVGTVEGLGDEEQLHPVQQAFHENHALQCGFCTPGLLISTAHLLDNFAAPTEDQILEMLGGHLCRCTGYQNIVTAVKVAAARLQLKQSKA